MSASLPGLSEPILLSRAQSLAPWTVAIAITSRAVRSFGRSFSPWSERSLIMTGKKKKKKKKTPLQSKERRLKRIMGETCHRAVIEVSTSLDKLARIMQPMLADVV